MHDDAMLTAQHSKLSRRNTARVKKKEEEVAGEMSWPAFLVAVGIGMCFVVTWCLIIPYTDLVLMGSELAVNHLPIAAIVTLVLLLGLRWLGGAIGGWRITAAQIIVVYVMVLVSAAIPSTGWTIHLLPTLVAPVYYATPANDWLARVVRYVPSWVAPTTPTTARWFFEGLPPGQALPWHDWAVPLTTWTVYAFCLFLTFFSMAALFRRPWIEEEKLTFPLADVPLMALDLDPTREKPFLKNPIMWAGFAIPVILRSLMGLHAHFPAIPIIPIVDLQIGAQIFTQRPWDVLGGLELNLHPCVVGLTYLLRSEVALSFPAFHIIYKLAEVFMNAIGVSVEGAFFSHYGYFRRYQRVGAFLAASALIIWTARRHLWLTVRAAFGQATRPYEDREALGPKWSVFGFAVGIASLLAFSVAAGGSFWLTAGTMVIFLSVAIVLSRIVSAAGLLWVNSNYQPMQIVTNTFSSAPFGGAAYAWGAMEMIIATSHQQNILMPSLMDTQRLGQKGGIPGRKLFIAAALALLVAVPLASMVSLDLIYEHGGLYLKEEFFTRHATWGYGKAIYFQNFLTPNPAAARGIVFGAIVMSLLTLAHRQYLWWPLYPLGYVLGDSFPMRLIWGAMFAGWAIKVIVMRFGGYSGYRRLRPGFVGMIIGDFVIAAVWLLIDYFTGFTGNNIFPGPGARNI